MQRQKGVKKNMGNFFLNDGSNVEGDKKRENIDLYFSTLRSSNLSKLPTVLTFHLRGSTGWLAGHFVCYLKVEWQKAMHLEAQGEQQVPPVQGSYRNGQYAPLGFREEQSSWQCLKTLQQTWEAPVSLAIKCTDAARDSSSAMGWRAPLLAEPSLRGSCLHCLLPPSNFNSI